MPIRPVVLLLAFAAVAVADDRPPPGAIARVGSTRFRVPADQGGVPVLSADGKRLAIGGGSSVTVFDPATGRRVCRIEQSGFADDMRFTPDGALTFVLSGETSGQVVKHDPETGKLLSIGPLPDQLPGIAVVSPDGTTVAHAMQDGVQIIDLAGGRPTVIRYAIANPVRALAFTPDCQRLLVAAERVGVDVYDRTGGRVGRVAAKEDNDRAVVSPDGTRAAVWDSSHDTIRVLDPRTATLLKVIKGRGNGPEQLAFAPGHGLLVYGGDTVRVLDPDTGATRRRFMVNPMVVGLTVSADGNTLYAATSGGAILVYDIATGRLLPVSADPPERLWQLRFVRPGRVVGYSNGYGWMGWDVGGGRGERIGRPLTTYEFADLSPDEKWVASFGPKGLTVAGVGADEPAVRVGRKQTGDVYYLEFAPDARTVYAATGRGLKAWDLPAGTPRQMRVANAGERVAMILACPDNRQLAVVATPTDAAPVIRLIDRETHQLVRTLHPNAPGTPNDLQFSRDGRRLAAVIDRAPDNHDAPPSLTVFDTATGRTVAELPGRVGSWTPLMLSPDGRSVATATNDDRLVILELATGGVRWEKPGTPEAVNWSHDGRTVISAGDDGVLIWDVRHRLGPTPPLDPAAAWAALASPDAAIAYRAMCALERHPAAAVELFRAKVPAAAAVDPVAIDRWIMKLAAPAFRDRQAATAALTAAADRCRARLTAARAAVKSAEARERLDAILLSADAPTPDRVRLLRVVEVARRLDTPAATALLKTWAGGAAGASLTLESR